MTTPKTAADRALADFWRAYTASSHANYRFLLHNPRQATQALLAIQKLPVVYPPRLSDSHGGRAVAQVLHQKGPGGLPARWWSFSALPIPADPTAALERPEAKRLRYNLRAAGVKNITTRPVVASERSNLVRMATHRDRTHPDPVYRIADPRNEDLLDHNLWTVAQDHRRRTLLLAVVAHDGELAVLRYFRTQGDTDAHSLSRYAAHHAVVEELAQRGVRWLLDNQPPGAQTNGVRLFQRIVGYRHVRVRRPGLQRAHASSLR